MGRRPWPAPLEPPGAAPRHGWRKSGRSPQQRPPGRTGRNRGSIRAMMLPSCSGQGGREAGSADEPSASKHGVGCDEMAHLTLASSLSSMGAVRNCTASGVRPATCMWEFVRQKRRMPKKQSANGLGQWPYMLCGGLPSMLHFLYTTKLNEDEKLGDCSLVGPPPPLLKCLL